SDVVTVGATSRIRYFDGRAPAQQTLLSSEQALPSLGNLTTDGRTSGVVVSTFIVETDNNALEGNLRVWRGSVDRTLLPTVYPNIDLTSNNVTNGRDIAASRYNQPGSEVFALFQT